MECSHQNGAESESPLLEPLRAVTHPVWLAALAALVANDWVLKGAVDAPLLTGKLSDLAGLVVAPTALAALLRVRRRTGLWWCAAAVGAVFAAINLSPAAATAWDAGIAAIIGTSTTWTDPTDLLALPAAVAGVLALRPAMRRRTRRAVPRGHWLLAVAAAAACLASTGPPEERSRRFEARLAVLNRTHELQVLRIRHLASDAEIDCERVRDAPGEYLTDEIFAEPRRWELFSGQQVGLAGAGQNGRPRRRRSECRAAKISVSTADDIVVFWGDDLEIREFSANPDGSRGELGGPQTIELTADYSEADAEQLRDFRYRPCEADEPCSEEERREAAQGPEGAEYGWNRDDEGRLFWGALDRNARRRDQIPRSCRHPLDHPGLTWTGVPEGPRPLREVERGPDGCHRLTFAPAETAGEEGAGAQTALVCAPWRALSQLEPAQRRNWTVSTLEERNFQGNRRSIRTLRISVLRLAGARDAEVGTIILSVGAPGPPLARNLDYSIPVGCGPRPRSCGRMDLPAHVRFPDPDVSGPVEPGRLVTRDEGRERIRIVRALYRPVARRGDSCDETSRAGSGSPDESDPLRGATGLYVEAVTTRGFE